MKTIHAVYESGVFRPLDTVELPERTEVEFEPRPVAQPEDRSGRLDGIYAILGERCQSGEKEPQRLSNNTSMVIFACFKMDCSVFVLISRCIGTQGWRPFFS